MTIFENILAPKEFLFCIRMKIFHILRPFIQVFVQVTFSARQTYCPLNAYIHIYPRKYSLNAGEIKYFCSKVLFLFKVIPFILQDSTPCGLMLFWKIGFHWLLMGLLLGHM